MQPNILFIMSDQLAPALTGAYGHSVVKTPSLDRLVADGVRYDAAYSSCPLGNTRVTCEGIVIMSALNISDPPYSGPTHMLYGILPQ